MRTGVSPAPEEHVEARDADLLEDWEVLADPLRPLAEEAERLASQFNMAPATLVDRLHRAGVHSRFDNHGRIKPKTQEVPS